MTTPVPEQQPEEEPKLRGRAAAFIRTGRFIKQYLEELGEASIASCHSKLVSTIGLENLRRPKGKRLQAPTYNSFLKYFDRLRRLGLVEWVRDEPMEAYWRDTMVSVRVAPPVEGVRMREAAVIEGGTRRVYRISELGKRPEMSVLWDDPLARGLMRRLLLGSQRSQGRDDGHGHVV